MVIETAPCYDSGEQPDGAPWPQDSSSRISAYNDLVREVAGEFPSSVSVQDLDESLSQAANTQPTFTEFRAHT